VADHEALGSQATEQLRTHVPPWRAGLPSSSTLSASCHLMSSREFWWTLRFAPLDHNKKWLIQNEFLPLV